MVRINPLKQAILQALFMGVSFCIFFAAYFPCEALLTSFRPRTSFLTLAIGYFFYGFSCLISPTTIKLLGPRVCLLLGAIPYPLWIGAQLLGIDGLCYAVSPFLGLGAAHLWPSSGTYLHKLNYWVMQENAVTFKTEVVPLAATQQDAPSPADTIQSPSPRTLSSPALPARRSSSIPAHEPVSPAEPLVSAPAVPVADPLPSLPSPPACTEMTPPAAGKLPSPTQPSPTTPQPPLPSLAPPAPAPVAASNMGLLSGTFYFMMSFSSVVGFLISSLLVADLALVYLTLFIIGCCGVGAMLLIPPIPAATAARAPPEKPPRAPATDARLPICASVPSASTGSVPPPRPRRRIVLAPVIADIAHSVRDTFDLFFSPAILLFQLTFVLYGMLYGFFVGAVPPLVATVAFVSPALICRGACCMLASPLFGRLSDRVGRFRVMGALYAIAGVALALVTTAVYARPAADWVFFLAYLAFGAFEGGTPTVVFGILSLLSPAKPEPAYSMWDVLQAVMAAVMFVLGGAVSFETRLVLVWALWGCATASFGALTVLVRKRAPAPGITPAAAATESEEKAAGEGKRTAGTTASDGRSEGGGATGTDGAGAAKQGEGKQGDALAAPAAEPEREAATAGPAPVVVPPALALPEAETAAI